MKCKKLNAVHVWKQFEDLLAPRLRLSVYDRAVYYNLVRHSQLEGKRRLHFSIPWLAQNIGLTVGPVRDSVRRFIDQGVFRLLHRSSQGHVIEVRLPEEIPAARPQNKRRRPGRAAVRRHSRRPGFPAHPRTAPGDPRARRWRVLLLSAPHPPWGALFGPCRAARGVWAQFVPQPRFLLPGMQLPEEAALGGRLCALALPRGALDGRGTDRTPSCLA
jgi:hypothetical protein